MLDTLKDLCALSGVSGCEDEVRDYILERASAHADRIATDSLGNICVYKKGSVSDRAVMLAAHMDEVGLIITDIGEKGYLSFSFVGGIDRRVIIGARVFIGPARVPGVIGIKAYHLVKAEEEKNVPELADLYIDIGAPDRAAAEKLVSLGDCAAFDDSSVEFGEGFFKAKAIDDRLGCAAMLTLLEEGTPCDTWFCFTAQEEVGCRGAAVAGYGLEAELCLIMEGTTAADIPGVEKAQQICRLGGGVVIPFMDGGAIYDRRLYKSLTTLADDNGVKWQPKTRIAGGTDASAIQRAGAGMRTAGIACALRNIHSPVSVMKLSDAEEYLRLARLFLAAAAEGTI